MREEALVNDVVEQRGFAGTGHAAETDEALERKAEGKFLKIVFGDVGEREPTRRVGGGVSRDSATLKWNFASDESLPLAAPHTHFNLHCLGAFLSLSVVKSS